MPSGLTINVSAATSALVQTGASQAARASVVPPAPTPNQMALASQAASERATLSLKRRDETSPVQSPPRVEATYGITKKKAKGDQEQESEAETAELTKSADGRAHRVDLKA